MQIVFASQNRHKLEEIAAMLGNDVELKSLNDFPIAEELPETGSTLKENALQKARYVADRFGVNCFADDTGLEVTALKGAPGVYSARYAGEERNAERNTDKLLAELAAHSDRSARFRTVIALILDGKEYFFEGTVEGRILPSRTGTGGFGYDPVFAPDGFEQSFAEMKPEEKNQLSHRARAVQKLVTFLKEK